jgi:hypothetical protein
LFGHGENDDDDDDDDDNGDLVITRMSRRHVAAEGDAIMQCMTLVSETDDIMAGPSDDNADDDNDDGSNNGSNEDQTQAPPGITSVVPIICLCTAN